MATYGFEFRATSGYVSTGANHTYVVGETSSQTRNGITFYWSSGTVGTADRNASVPPGPELAGVNYAGPGGATAIFSVTLPSIGLKNIRFALGDPWNVAFALLKVVIRDNGGSPLLTIGPQTPSGNTHVIDATGVSLTKDNWAANNLPTQVMFNTSAFTLELSGATYGTLAYLEIADVGGAAPAVIPFGLKRLQALTRGSLH